MIIYIYLVSIYLTYSQLTTVLLDLTFGKKTVGENMSIMIDLEKSLAILGIVKSRTSPIFPSIFVLSRQIEDI